MTLIGFVCAAPADSVNGYIDLGVPEAEVAFQDQSALKQEDNLKSKVYQDFIHQLYRFDKDNLNKADGLFSSAGGNEAPQVPSGPKWTDFETPQSLNAPDVLAPEIYEIYSNRQKRGLFFRPLFIYREQQDDQQHEQVLRSKRHHHSHQAYRHLNDDDDNEY